VAPSRRFTTTIITITTIEEIDMFNEASQRWREAVNERLARTNGDRDKAFRLAYREARHLAEAAKREGQHARRY
jgi:hypothetical protein